MTTEQIIERVKSLGPEWHHAAGKLEDAVRAAETARADRIAFMGKCIASTTDRLAKLKEEIRTLPEQIEKWEAERAHLEASTAVGLMMGDVKGGDDHRPDEPSKSADTDNAVESSDGPDVAPPSVGKAEGASNPFAYRFDGAGYQVSTDPTRKWYSVTGAWEAGYRPHGKTRAEVEAMADARIIGDTPQVETTSLAEAATQPTTKPPEDDDPAERAFWRFCMLIDKTQSTTRVKAGYLEGPYTQRDAFKIAVRSTILGAEMPEPPALLDLRTLKVGTVCEATADIQMCRITIHIAKGACFAVVEDHDAQRLPGEASVRVDARDGSWRIPALVPARVVEVPR